MSGQQHAPAALYPREIPGTHFTGRWVVPRAVLDGCGKYLPHRDSIPDRPARSSVAIPTELPGNINKYQEYLLKGKGGRCVGLTTLPPSCADCLEIWEPQTPGTLRVCPGLSRDCFATPTSLNDVLLGLTQSLMADEICNMVGRIKLMLLCRGSTVPGYYKTNRHFKCCIETKLLTI